MIHEPCGLQRVVHKWQINLESTDAVYKLRNEVQRKERVPAIISATKITTKSC